MSAVQRYISDPHFGHKNMAERRGFSSVKEHDEYIISKWNQVVSKHDTTWILGDITMHKKDFSVLDRLNGIKRVVLGNHDEGKYVKYMLPHINSVHGLIRISHKKYGKIWLSHCPVHPDEFKYRIDFNIHGHIHGYELKDKRYIKVCMEVQDYTPKTLEELLDNRMKKNLWRKVKDLIKKSFVGLSYHGQH